jgi:DNA helicase-2/ATP-dependent DNA helicase PcrA
MADTMTTTRRSTAETDPLLDDLTTPQRDAVTHVEGPLLVLAGAGSGKTRVITRRIAHLILRVGIAPWQVAAITFTNKAAGEMRDRVTQLMSESQARALTVCTYHSLCARVIRAHAEPLGLTPGYSIYDTSNQKAAVKSALESLDLSAGNFPPATVLATISNAKNELIDADEFTKTAFDFYSKSVARVYAKYQSVLKKNNALDFDDLLVKMVELLRDHTEVAAALRDRYQYVLIDEYQDTNHAQFMIAHALTGGPGSSQNICVTGDPDQSIYAWRGANIRNILEFESHYPAARTIRLEQNYRSTKRILAVADTLIKHNRKRRDKDLWTQNDQGDHVALVKCYNERHEAQWLVDRLTELNQQEGLAWGAMAVFYRVNSLSRVIEDALREARVPYQIARGTAFYERQEIKDSIAFLRIIANPNDEVSLARIINTPARGISDRSVKAMQAHALAHDVTMAAVVAQPAQVPALNTRAVNSIERFHKMVNAWRVQAGLAPSSVRADAGEHEPTLRFFVQQMLRESGLEQYYRKDTADPGEERIMNLGELVSSAQQFEDELQRETQEMPTFTEKLMGYLEQVSLVSDVDAIDDNQGAVTLMTLHAAKGLEFSAIVMAGVEDGLLPHTRSQDDDDAIEEERRLFFVGMTRAMRNLMLTFTRERTVYGQTLPAIPSRFLRELPSEHVDTRDLSDAFDPYGEFDEEDNDLMTPRAARRADALRQVDEFSPGTMVRHPSFGLGRVITVNNVGSQTRARVEFNTAGVKTLVLQYARLERVSP